MHFKSRTSNYYKIVSFLIIFLFTFNSTVLAAPLDTSTLRAISAKQSGVVPEGLQEELQATLENKTSSSGEQKLTLRQKLTGRNPAIEAMIKSKGFTGTATKANIKDAIRFLDSVGDFDIYTYSDGKKSVVELIPPRKSAVHPSKTSSAGNVFSKLFGSKKDTSADDAIIEAARLRAEEARARNRKLSEDLRKGRDRNRLTFAGSNSDIPSDAPTEPTTFDLKTGKRIKTSSAGMSIEEIRGYLITPDESIRKYLSEALGVEPEKITPNLTGILHKRLDGYVNNANVVLAESMGRLNEPYTDIEVSAIKAALNDKLQIQRLNALKELRQRDGEAGELFDELLALLSSVGNNQLIKTRDEKGELLRKRADAIFLEDLLYLLGNIEEDGSMLKTVADYLHYPESGIKIVALNILASKGSEALFTEEEIRDVLADHHQRDVRRKAIVALKQIGANSKATIELLEQKSIQDGEDSLIKLHAQSALAAIESAKIVTESKKTSSSGSNTATMDQKPNYHVVIGLVRFDDIRSQKSILSAA